MKFRNGLTSLLLLVGFANIPAISFAQELKIIKEINNSFIDRKDEWAKDKKLNFGLMSWNTISIKLSGNTLTLDHSKSTGDAIYGMSQPVNSDYEQECWGYSNAKISVNVKPLSADPAKTCGLILERRLDPSTIRAGNSPNTSGPMDWQTKSFTFLINGNGDVSIQKSGTTSLLLFKKFASTFYLAGVNNLLTIERKGLTLDFYLNNNLIHSYTDNSYGNLADIKFAVEAGGKAAYETPSFIYYDKGNIPYERLTTGITTYKDNECGFKVMEGNIEKQCPTAELNKGNVRYYSHTCYKEDPLLSYGIIFFRSDAAATDPISEFMNTYLKVLYNSNVDESTFATNKAIYQKENEGVLVEKIKNDFITLNPKVTGVQFSTLNDLVVGNNQGRFFDIAFENDGVSSVRREFYSYTTKGLMIIQFDALKGALDTNPVYNQIISNVYSF